MEDIEEIRKRKLEELKKIREQEQQQVQQELQKQLFFKQIMTPEARERLTRIKMANPAYAEQVEALLIQLAQSGRLRGIIDEEVGDLWREVTKLEPEPALLP